MSEEREAVEFLRRRWASAIQSGDDRTAMRLRAQLDRLLNGRLAGSHLRLVAPPDRSAGRPREQADLLASIWDAAPGPRGPRRGLLAAVGEDVADWIA